MNLITIIAVLLISLLYTGVFVAGLKSRGPWGSGWSFFSIVCLWLTAVSLWIPPAAPLWIGAPWIDLLGTGLLVSFVLSATSVLSSRPIEYPTRERAEKKGDPVKSEISTLGETTRERDIRHKDQKTLKTAAANLLTLHHPLILQKTKLRTGGFLWILLLCLCALIIIGAV